MLDGFPRAYKGAQNIFYKWTPELDEDGNLPDEPEQDLEEGQEKDWTGYTADPAIFPSNCIVLHG